MEKNHKFEEEIALLANKTKKTMGIEEFVLERERRIGEKKGIEKGIEAKSIAFAQALLAETDFDDAKIASLAGVSLEVVQKLRVSQK